MRGVRISASVLKIIVGMLFVVSAACKFMTIDIFEIYVYSFGFFPLNVSYYVARMVLAAELVLGAALISNRNHRFSVVATLLFLVVFIVFLSYAHLIGRTDDCHCFGELIPFDPVQSIVKNAVLVLLLLFAYKFADTERVPKWWLAALVYIAVAVVLTAYMVFSLHLIYKLVYVMLIVMLCVGVVASFNFSSKWYVTTLLILTPFVTIFILTPPDSWFYRGTSEVFDQELLVAQFEAPAEGADAGVAVAGDTVAVAGDSAAVVDVDNMRGALAGYGLGRGRHAVAFFSPGCGYCRLAAEKLSTVVERNEIDTTMITYVFPQLQNQSGYSEFYERSRSMRFREARIDKNLFLHITRGSFPVIVLVDDGQVVASFAYRNINEQYIVDFLKK